MCQPPPKASRCRWATSGSTIMIGVTRMLASQVVSSNHLPRLLHLLRQRPRNLHLHLHLHLQLRPLRLLQVVAVGSVAHLTVPLDLTEIAAISPARLKPNAFSWQQVVRDAIRTGLMETM